jgi:hypothetical protein
MSGILAIGVLALCAFAESVAAQPEPPKSDGVCAILVADTKKGPAGTFASHTAIESTLKLLRESGVPVEITSIVDDGVAPSAILAAIRGLDPAKMANRTLFFYYAGHGATDARGGTGHFLRTPHGDLSRAVLVAEIRAKAPPLAVIVTDSCSGEARMKGPAPPAPMPIDRKVAENLFLQHRGIVDLNGSTYDAARGVGQAAFYHPGSGGLFTRAFNLMFPPGFEARGLKVETRPGKVWDFDDDRDGFLEWSEAIEFLRAETTRGFEMFREEVTKGLLRVHAAPADVARLLSQVGQDPQCFGALALRSDGVQARAPADAAPNAARTVRLGAYLEDKASWSGGYVVITRVDPRSPASRATERRYGEKIRGPVPVPAGVIVTRVNARRVRSRDEFFRVLDSTPEGGELSISGFRDEGGRRFGYEATVVLDRFE